MTRAGPGGAGDDVEFLGGTAGLTSTTPLTPLIASSMLAGTARSPAAISAPASASALAVAFAGSRTSTRTGTSRSRSRRAVSEPTFPAVVTRIMMSLFLHREWVTAPTLTWRGVGCQTQKDGSVGLWEARHVTARGSRPRESGPGPGSSRRPPGSSTSAVSRAPRWMTSGQRPGSAGPSCRTTSPAKTSLCRRSSATRPRPSPETSGRPISAAPRGSGPGGTW